MRVVLVNTSYPPNISAGAERVVQTLAEALVGEGHQASVVTTEPGDVAVLREVHGVRVHYLPIRNLRYPFNGIAAGPLARAAWHIIDSWNIAMARKVADIISSERPDVVNTHNLVGLSSASMVAAARLGVPIVHTMHDQYLLCPKGTMFKNGRNCNGQCLGCRVLSIPRKRATDSVSATIGVSRFILERHRSRGYFQHATSHVIYNAFGHKVAAGNLAAPRKAKFTFGYLGQIRSTKGVHRLLEAFLAECADKANLVIAGSGDDAYEASLRNRSAGHPSIQWLGHTDPVSMLAKIDVLVVPSLWNDTAPLVLIEAFENGVPVLGANRGGIPEFIQADRGWLFEPDDFGAFRRSLRKCIASASAIESMAEASRRYAKQFTRARFLQNYLAVFDAVIGRTRHGPPGPLQAETQAC